MKRIIFLAAITGFILATSGCSNGPLSGVMGAGNNCGNGCSNGLFGGSVLPSNFLSDGPVRQWLRGDACDSCNVPAGQITYDSGFDSSCESCGTVSSPVVSGPITSAPATNYYPSYNENYPSYDESLPPISSAGPIEGTNGIGGISESQFFGGANDNIELPPLLGN